MQKHAWAHSVYLFHILLPPFVPSLVSYGSSQPLHVLYFLLLLQTSTYNASVVLGGQKSILQQITVQNNVNKIVTIWLIARKLSSNHKKKKLSMNGIALLFYAQSIF